ncbi:hypothetical protein SASPL_147102 [Salvia splendens]|uniref:Leucine-rich repeat-containing N-terminal plant-type domain-containing protein n=1 Tax=Salvia splendens TaxID=180675 RepID=A0A8X8WEX2_SALSN|nr:hypothetical protein SASPL_147102 [Salvia splendens]
MRWKSSLSSSASLKSWSVNNINNYCRWIGIRCNDGGSVPGIDLLVAGLAGTLDMFYFTSLLNLTTFNLYGNDLNGSIPALLETSQASLSWTYPPIYFPAPFHQRYRASIPELL